VTADGQRGCPARATLRVLRTGCASTRAARLSCLDLLAAAVRDATAVACCLVARTDRLSDALSIAPEALTLLVAHFGHHALPTQRDTSLYGKCSAAQGSRLGSVHGACTQAATLWASSPAQTKALWRLRFLPEKRRFPRLASRQRSLARWPRARRALLILPIAPVTKRRRGPAAASRSTHRPPTLS
jgi:hypothetical protein